jgi:hypothetical protein
VWWQALCALAKRVVYLFTEPYTRYRRERGGAILQATARDCAAPVHPEYSQPLSEACELLPETVRSHAHCRRLRAHALAMSMAM